MHGGWWRSACLRSQPDRKDKATPRLPFLLLQQTRRVSRSIYHAGRLSIDLLRFIFRNKNRPRSSTQSTLIMATPDDHGVDAELLRPGKAPTVQDCHSPQIEPSEVGEPAARQRLFASLLRTWIREILFYLLSFVFFLAIIITLASHDGNTLPRWPWGISLNALVSVFTTLFKVGLSAVVAAGKCCRHLDYCCCAPE